MTKDDVFPLVEGGFYKLEEWGRVYVGYYSDCFLHTRPVDGGIGVSFSEEVLHDDEITITRLQEV